nr:MmpS family transport accessory protein [Mycobacterium simiae]
MMSRLWIPLVVTTVLVVGGLVVYRVHSHFGPRAPESYAGGNLAGPQLLKPKSMVYEIFGTTGTLADISYFDVNSDPQRLDRTPLPWSLRITMTKPGALGDLIAQGNSDSIGCRITIDGEVKAERISHEVNAYTFCLVKSA